jgi:hypothetical protein
LAKAEKYRVYFNSLNGLDYRIEFWFEGYAGSVIELQASESPFTVKEFNTEEDIFKPIRPFLAEINLVGSSTGVTMNDFIADNDTDIDVYLIETIVGGGLNLFKMILLQDDFREEWIDQNHIITLTAADRFGYLKEVELSNNGTELDGTYTPIELMSYAMQQTSVSFAFLTIINNLFHTSMTSSNTYHPLDQCKINAKTFQIQGSTYDNSYNVLEKINSAFNQTIFIHENKPFILRLEELYTSYNNNLRGAYINNTTFPTPTRTLVDKRYDVFIGVNQEVKPIDVTMLRYLRRKTKKDTVQFYFEQWDEIIKNQTFERGTIFSSSSTLKLYTVSNWDWQTGTPGSPTTPTTGDFKRAETYASNGSITDNYVYITQDSSTNRWIKSQGSPVLANETFTFSVDHRYKSLFSGSSTRFVASFQLVTATNYYTLNDDGSWALSNSSFTTNYKALQAYLDGAEGVLSTDWSTYQVSAKPIPADGTLYVLLWCVNAGFVSGQEAWYKNMQIEYNTNFNGYIEKSITGIQSIYTKSLDVKNSFQDTIFLDDGVSRVYNGSIFQSNGTTLTDLNWYRYRYSSERYGFRRQNAVANWEHNRLTRNKIDGTFYGILWDDAGSQRHIGLMNTFRFVDDDVNKVYAILNLKFIDYQNNTWGGTLIEVYDEVKDSNISATFEANFTPGNYTTTYTMPMTLVSAGGFSIVSGNSARYNGIPTINTPVDCNITFSITGVSSSPASVTVQLKKNSTVLKTVTQSVFSTPQPLYFDMSVTSQSIATNDIFTLTLSTNVTSYTITGGSILINTPNSTQAFDTYTDKYLYK